MNYLKTSGRVLLEIFFFTLPFFWAPLWVQCIIGAVLSLAMEWFLFRRQKGKLNNTIESIDFSKFKKNVHQ